MEEGGERIVWTFEEKTKEVENLVEKRSWVTVTSCTEGEGEGIWGSTATDDEESSIERCEEKMVGDIEGEGMGVRRGDGGG